MKKIWFLLKFFEPKRCKIWNVMKWCVIFTVFLSFSVSAEIAAQQEKVNLNLSKANLQTLFQEIQRQTGLYFVYNEELCNTFGEVNVNAKSLSVKQVLDDIFRDKELTYYFEDKIIVVKANSRQTEVEKRKITGKVVDKEGTPLPGVGILIEGTTVGVSTDVDGKYTIECPPVKDLALLFSFVGMKPHREVVGDKSVIDVIMQEEVQQMDEVVVTGIFTRKKESFTGSSQTYTSKELKVIGNSNVLQSLKTMDPSFMIVENNQFGSDPNHLANINVRGKTSVIGLTQEYETDPNQPLFILDGFESTLQTISDLSMDRVQSITILKDAAATAIYGSKAANGVVVVETKAPVSGSLRLTYNGNLNLSWADLSDYNLMDSSEKLEFERLSGHYGTLDENGEIVDARQQQLYYQRLAEVKRGVDTYWMSEPLRLAATHSHNLFAEGGDGKMRYGLGLSYNKTQGVMKGSDRDVLNGNVRLMYRFKNIAFTNYLNVDYVKSSREKVAFSEFSKMNPYYRKVNEYGDADLVLEEFPDPDYPFNAPTRYIYNPLYDWGLNSSNTSEQFGIRNNFEVDWRVLDELRVRGRFSITKNDTKGVDFRSPKATEFIGKDDSEKGIYTESNTGNLSYDADFNVTYGKLLKEKHMVNVVGGMRLVSNKTNMSSFLAKGFIDDRYQNPSFSIGYPNGSKPGYSNAETRSASYYLNGGYAYDDRYLLDLNLRSDGSSVFGLSDQFTTTWAVGLGWNAHNENFIKKLGWIDFLKLRYSVGNPGNQNFDAYISMNVYKYASTYPNQVGLGAIISSWGNRNLEWQKTIDQNFGIDLAFLDNRLKLTVDYFYKNTDPLLVYVQLPSSTGTTQAPMNMGKQVTKGTTMVLNGTVLRTEDISWNLNFNMRHITSEYRNIGNLLDKYNKENRSSNLTRFYDGGSPTDLWAVRSAGIDPASGREVFIKKDGTQTFKFDYDDEVVVGNTEPKYEGVIGTSFYYKGFSVSVNLRYRWGGQIFMNTLYNKVENISEWALKNNQDKRALYDRWQKPGDVAKFKAISLTETTPISSRFVKDENTLSGESISIGYETQAAALKKYGISSLTVRGYMNDIFRISTVKDERGLDYPFARSVSFSLGLTF